MKLFKILIVLLLSMTELAQAGTNISAFYFPDFRSRMDTKDACVKKEVKFNTSNRQRIFYDFDCPEIQGSMTVRRVHDESDNFYEVVTDIKVTTSNGPSEIQSTYTIIYAADGSITVNKDFIERYKLNKDTYEILGESSCDGSSAKAEVSVRKNTETPEFYSEVINLK